MNMEVALVNAKLDKLGVQKHLRWVEGQKEELHLYDENVVLYVADNIAEAYIINEFLIVIYGNSYFIGS